MGRTVLVNNVVMSWEEYLKYLDTLIPYENKNVNPKNRKTSDCVVRAIANTLGISYEEAIDKCAFYAKKTCYGITSKQVTEAVLKEYGYVKMKQPKKDNGLKYYVGELNQILTKKQLLEGVLVSMAHHESCIKNGKLQDTWDCRMKKVSNYYIKADTK